MKLFEVTLTPLLAVFCAVSLNTNASIAGGHGSHMNRDVTTINGQPVPGRMLPLQNEVVLIDTVTTAGVRMLVTRGTRKAGTRMAIHTHAFDGFTCVLQGEITIFIEGHAPKKQASGTCYHMPANTPMSAANLGHEDAVLTDNFVEPTGDHVVVVLEPGYPAE